jgi:lysophospholipase L1-like esterase
MFFWNSTSIPDDPLFFIEDAEPAVAALLFPPECIIALRSAAGPVEYEEGKDFLVDAARGLVQRPSGSRIPITSRAELRAADHPEHLFHQRRVSVSYTYRAGQWNGYIPPFSGDLLPRTLARLRDGRPLSIAVTGDSISEGYSASGFDGVPPHQPPYPGLLAAGLARRYRSAIALHNFAVAGSTADNLRWDTGPVSAAAPDLVIVAFGMNDSGYAAPADFAANIAAILAGIRRSTPDAEFVLVSPMLPNTEWDYPVMERFPAYRDALAGLCAAGTVLADVTSIWTDLLRRKTVYDLTANGLNHPNDFGHQVYAQAILALLIDPR